MQYCFNPLNTKAHIRPFEMLLSNQGRMTSCAKIASHMPKTYIYLITLSRFINNNCSFWSSENHV